MRVDVLIDELKCKHTRKNSDSCLVGQISASIYSICICTPQPHPHLMQSKSISCSHAHTHNTNVSSRVLITEAAGAVEVQYTSQNKLQLGICAAEGLAIVGNIVLTFSIFACRRLDANILMAPFQFLAR